MLGIHVSFFLLYSQVFGVIKVSKPRKGDLQCLFTPYLAPYFYYVPHNSKSNRETQGSQTEK